MKWILALLLTCLSLSAQQVITATVAVTNAAGTTNGDTITINGTLRTFTNNVQNNVQIFYGTNTTLAASNIYTAYIVNPQSKVITSWVNGTNVAFQCYPGSGLTASISAGWGTISLVTNTIQGAIVVRVPASVEGGLMQTNIGSQLEQYLESSTNALPPTNTFASNYVSLSQTQTISGVKALTNVANQLYGTFVGTITNGIISGTIYAATNGTLWRTIITNSPSIQTTNLITESLFLMDPATGISTNTAQLSAGSFLIHAPTYVETNLICNEFWLYGNGPNYLTMDYDWTSDRIRIAATGGGKNPKLYVSKMFVTNDTTLGTLSTTNLEAVGTGVTATNIIARGTNAFPAGGDVSFGRFAISSLANGNNAGVIVGTNVFCDLSGPSGAFTINGINGSPNRDGKVVMLHNNTGFALTLANDSGTDPVAGNRIYTGYNADTSYTNKPGIITLIYNANLSRWVIVSAPRTSNFP